MADDNSKINWDAVFRAGMPEFAASQFAFTREDQSQIRIAFGNGGPINKNGTRTTPVYTHAVTLSPDTALELARLLLKHYAEPAAPHKTSDKV